MILEVPSNLLFYEVKKTHGHCTLNLLRRIFLRKGITTPGIHKGHISIVYFCELPYNLDFSLESHSHPFYIKASTFIKVSLSKLTLKAFVGLLFVYKLVFIISTHVDILQFRKYLNMQHFNGKPQVSFSECYWQILEKAICLHQGYNKLK